MIPGVAAPLVDPPVHPQAPLVVPPPVGPVDPFSMSYAQYEAIIYGQQVLQSRQMAFESRFEDSATTTTDSLFEMRSLLRGLSGLSPPIEILTWARAVGGLPMTRVGRQIDAVFS
ncbi:hypothetical protein MRB53_028313 [Persea americana]|uniref:Uncharacterized protein n=1 Tax=Persea americana TaxID=3435 RepID=A0ACC2KFQ0_PERAE|nr:hypothetical protein MRB53_028313 [Persea americana]